MAAVSEESLFTVSDSCDLTAAQREAVEHLTGPLLVLAGPGSGKTRVITRRIARMVERGVDSRRILAITFTNKAASEMADRVKMLLPGSAVQVSTFHKFCARLLRQRGEMVGLRSNYSIYDTTDQKSLIRRILRDLDIEATSFPPPRIAARISRAKNDLISAEVFSRRFSESIGDHLEAVVARVYPVYQGRLLESNAVDFDDLLLHVVDILSNNPELRRQYDERYQYVLVDEYQDTNKAQYRIVTALSQTHPNLCVTGDPDQSIYGWRGARIDNILRFEKDFPQTTVVRLEQNFRSTGHILRAADSLIAHNVHRKAKSLITSNADGEPVELRRYRDGEHEADAIARDIQDAVESGARRWSDFAIFYRVNALSREIERAFSRHRIPFQVAAGTAFYERAEVKDLLAYLQLVHNPDNQAAFLRIINVPRRGIGRVTLQRLTAWASAQGVNLPEAASRAGEVPRLSKRAVRALTEFASMLDELRRHSVGSVRKLLEMVLARTDYGRDWVGSDLEQDQQRLANVGELVTAARQYDGLHNENTSLEGFLESTSLTNDVDGLDDEAGTVTLMTLHAAKGLEFPVVYTIAVEHNLIPHERALRDYNPAELEEERRLLFVGVTRARERLILTQTTKREIRGQSTTSIPSQFLTEMRLAQHDLTIDASARFPRPGERTERHMDTDDRERTRRDSERTDPASGNRPVVLTGRSAGIPLLMTAADLMNDTVREAEIPQGFAVGMAVRHPQDGLGTVVGTSGFSHRRMVTVEFHETGETRTFVVSKCPLQPVGNP